MSRTDFQARPVFESRFFTSQEHTFWTLEQIGSLHKVNICPGVQDHSEIMDTDQARKESIALSIKSLRASSLVPSSKKGKAGLIATVLAIIGASWVTKKFSPEARRERSRRKHAKDSYRYYTQPANPPATSSTDGAKSDGNKQTQGDNPAAKPDDDNTSTSDRFTNTPANGILATGDAEQLDGDKRLSNAKGTLSVPAAGDPTPTPRTEAGKIPPGHAA